MTDSSSNLLQIQGKWYQERKPKKNPKPFLNFWTLNIAAPWMICPRWRWWPEWLSWQLRGLCFPGALAYGCWQRSLSSYWVRHILWRCGTFFMLRFLGAGYHLWFEYVWIVIILGTLYNKTVHESPGRPFSYMLCMLTGRVRLVSKPFIYLKSLEELSRYRNGDP